MSEIYKSLRTVPLRYIRIPLPVLKTRCYSNFPPEGNENKPKPLRWTKPWSEKDGEWYTRFKLFAPEKGLSAGWIKFVTTPVDLRPQTFKGWLDEFTYKSELCDQQYLSERHAILGSDLAAAHFVVYRGGSVRFLGRDQWVKLDKNDEYDLPQNFQPNMFLTDIDCANMKIHYEGLENLVRLKHLESISFKNCPNFDDFCLDRIAGEFGETLIHLDISGCPISERGLVALYKTIKLQTLIVSDIKRSTAFELTCAMLEELYPTIEIKEPNDVQKAIDA